MKARRSFIFTVASLGLLVALRATPSLAADREITVQAWGTAWEQGFSDIAAAFEKKTGIHVVQVTQSGSADGYSRLQSMKDAPKIDVWFTTSSFAARVVDDEKLFKGVPAASLSNRGSLIDGALNDKWLAAYFYPVSIIYRPDLVKGGISQWTDLWKPEFKSAIATPDMSTYQGRMLLVSALTHGGSPDNVEPGFAAWKALRSNIAMFYGSDSDVRRALAQGEIVAMVGPPSQAAPLRADGVQVAVVSPQPSPVMFDVMVLVNTPKSDMAVQFMNYVVSSDAQKIVADKYNMGPVNSGVMPAPELAAAFPKASDRVSFDDKKINANIASWNERFQSEIAH